MKFKKTSFILVVIIVAQLLFSITAGAAYVDGKYISSGGACVMDYETGDILYQYNGYVNRSPASMTKVMSLYCIFEALETNNIPLDTVVPISNYVYNMPSTTSYQCIPLYYGKEYTVDQLIGAVATYSASNALMALVEFVAGNEREFVKKMNATASRMGLNATYYDSCGGYTNSISPVAMATLARNIITDYPQILERTSKPYIVFNGSKYYSTNKLYSTHYYPGVDGLKTGTSSTAGCCFCGTAIRNGERVITVTMLSAGGTTRFQDTIALMDYGFNKMKVEYPEKLCYAYSKVVLNGYEIPVLEYMMNNISKPVLCVEDLQYYGFDVVYNEQTNTIEITLNPEKEITALSCENYRGKYGNRFSRVSGANNVKVVLYDGVNQYEMSTVYSSQKRNYIYAEEFGYKFDLYWTDATTTIDVFYNNNYPNGNSSSFVPETLNTAQ